MSPFHELFSDERFGFDATTPETATERPRLLKDQRDQLINHRKTLVKGRFICVVVAAIASLGAPILLIWGAAKWAATIAAWGALFYLFFLLIRQRMRELGEEVDLRDNELDLLTIEDGQEEKRAQKLFQLHSRQLKEYYDQALRQGASIFWVGLLCIVLGFGVIGLTFWLIRDDALVGTSEKVIVGALGAVGGILANFIALIYLRMHSETVRSTTEFHNRLVLTHHLHFGNFLAAKIKNPSLRENTLGLIAQTLAGSLAKPEAEILHQLGDPGANGRSPAASRQPPPVPLPPVPPAPAIPTPTSRRRRSASRLRR